MKTRFVLPFSRPFCLHFFPLGFLCAALACGSVYAQAIYASATLTPEAALTAAQAALASCRESGYQIGVTVSDRSGTPIVMLRDRYAGPHTAETSGRKAYTSVNFRLSTANLATSTEAGTTASGIRFVNHIIALGGGLPIESAGALVGGIGVSGAPGPGLDEACAQAGIDAIQMDLDLP